MFFKQQTGLFLPAPCNGIAQSAQKPPFLGSPLVLPVSSFLVSSPIEIWFLWGHSCSLSVCMYRHRQGVSAPPLLPRYWLWWQQQELMPPTTSAKPVRPGNEGRKELQIGTVLDWMRAQVSKREVTGGILMPKHFLTWCGCKVRRFLILMHSMH